MQRLGWRVSYPWREEEEEEEVEDDENEMARPTVASPVPSLSLLFLLPYLSSDDEAVTVGPNSTRLKQGRNSLFKWSDQPTGEPAEHD